MLTDEMKAAGWIEHDGASWPDGLNLASPVQVLRLSGSVEHGLAGDFNGLDWYHGESVFSPSSDIIAYKPENSRAD